MFVTIDKESSKNELLTNSLVAVYLLYREVVTLSIVLTPYIRAVLVGRITLFS